MDIWFIVNLYFCMGLALAIMCRITRGRPARWEAYVFLTLFWPVILYKRWRGTL